MRTGEDRERFEAIKEWVLTEHAETLRRLGEGPDMNANIDEAHYPDRPRFVVEPAQFEKVPSIKCTVAPPGVTPGTCTLLRDMLNPAAQTWLWSTVVDEGATVIAKYPDGTTYTWQPN